MNSSLCFLGLAKTGLGDDKCEVIGNALCSSNLAFLSMSGNEIGDGGAAALCHGVEHNSTLKFLDLPDNQITRFGAEVIGRCVQFRAEQNFALHRVWMAGNPAGKEFMMACMVDETFGGFLSLMDFIHFCVR